MKAALKERARLDLSRRADVRVAGESLERAAKHFAEFHAEDPRFAAPIAELKHAAETARRALEAIRAIQGGKS